MKNFRVISDLAMNKRTPRPISAQEMTEVLEFICTLHWYDLEDDEHNTFEAVICEALQRATIAVFDSTAHPDFKKVAAVLWNTNEGEFSVFEWDEEHGCCEVTRISD